MKKIPTLFKREFKNHKVVSIFPEVTEGLEWVLRGEGSPKIKVDGACCAIINGELYKRYDAKKGKTPPAGAIPCCDPDPVTGHWPHWVKCDRENPADKWFFAAFDCYSDKVDGTYEAVGKHFNGNPYNMTEDRLYRHEYLHLEADLSSFEKIKKYLSDNDIEGIVWWKDGEPMCKIKRTDFGMEWPTEAARTI